MGVDIRGEPYEYLEEGIQEKKKRKKASEKVLRKKAGHTWHICVNVKELIRMILVLRERKRETDAFWLLIYGHHVLVKRKREDACIINRKEQ